MQKFDLELTANFQNALFLYIKNTSQKLELCIYNLTIL
jgi:hypothetical protein